MSNPQFRRAHYEKAALIVRQQADHGGSKRTLMLGFLKLFDEPNTRFDENRFWKACGLRKPMPESEWLTLTSQQKRDWLNDDLQTV